MADQFPIVISSSALVESDTRDEWNAMDTRYSCFFSGV